MQQWSRTFLQQRAQVGTSIAWDLARKKRAREFTIRERGVKARAGCGARKTEKIWRFGPRHPVDQKRETQVVENRLDLSNA